MAKAPPFTKKPASGAKTCPGCGKPMAKCTCKKGGKGK